MISHFLRASLFTFYLLRSFSLQLCNTGLTIQSSHGFKIVRECLAGLISAVSYSCTQVRRATTLLASIAFTTKRRFLAPRFALSCYRLNHIIYICRKYIHLKYSISPWLLYPCDYNTTTYPCHCLATVRKKFLLSFSFLFYSHLITKTQDHPNSGQPAFSSRGGVHDARAGQFWCFWGNNWKLWISWENGNISKIMENQG